LRWNGTSTVSEKNNLKERKEEADMTGAGVMASKEDEVLIAYK